MASIQLFLQAEKHLRKLCVDIPTRQLGSLGNQAAVQYFAQVMEENGFTVERQPFACIDMRQGDTQLSAGARSFEAFICPYSLGCDIRAELIHATTTHQLEQMDIRGKQLLLSGEIIAEQLMPKNYIFYNPESHQRVHRLLEKKQPAAVIAATGRNQELAGGMYPFLLFEDGDFVFPAAYMKDVEGQELAKYIGSEIHLKMDAERIPSITENISAQKGDRGWRIMVRAHIDAMQGTPGALDNASGTTILMLLAELMKAYQGRQGVEILAINGEDNYSAGGELEYLRRHQGKFGQIRLDINIDGVGYKEMPTGISYYECPENIKASAEGLLADHPGIEEMPQWSQGDHMVFLSQGVPAIALTTAGFSEVWADIAHTEKDIMAMVDCGKLADAARYIHELITRF